MRQIVVLRSAALQGRMLQDLLGPDRLSLLQQHLSIEGTELVLVEPANVDEVMDMYIKRGNDTSQRVPNQSVAN